LKVPQGEPVANGRGGKRPGAGRKPLRKGWQEFCREVVRDKKVQAKIKAAAEADPQFALKLAEHGFGRPSQALQISHGTIEDKPLEFVIQFSDGRSAATPPETVPGDPVP
jgi:hypothetical protein